MWQKKYSSFGGNELAFCPGILGVQQNTTLGNVSGPKLPWTHVTLGRLSVSSGLQVPSP